MSTDRECKKEQNKSKSKASPEYVVDRQFTGKLSLKELLINTIREKANISYS